MGMAVELRGVGVRFRRRGHRQGILGLRGPRFWALRDIDLEVEAGRCMGVIGHNGSGKTTLLQVVGGVFRPDEGELRTAGRVSSLVELQAGVMRDLTGYENLTIQGVLLGLSRAELRQRYDEIVEFTGLSDDELASPVRTYSAGMTLRLGFSIVVHTEPDILLVDEVLAVGDEEFQAKCVDRVERMRRGGCAVILVSHDLDLVKQECDRAAVLHHGRLDFVGAVDEALVRYRDLVHAE